MTAPNDPDSSLQLMNTFLSRFHVEAVAHGDEELSEQEKSKLTLLANGDLPDDERKALLPLLSNRQALEFLSTQVKSSAR